MCAFQAEAEKQRRSRSALAMDLRGAAARGEFELVYQRQNVVTTEEIVGFEALLRWNHPGQGTISPAVFIPLAEELGIIDAVGEWVLRSACADAAMWPMPLRVAVNVAPAQLANPHFSAIVRRILAASGLDPTRLELEVTETGILTDVTQALETTRQLKALGIAIAMDDYGTGYSSLSMLQKFPFDKIKIDGEFISALTANPHSSAIILATIALGRSLQIPVLAEGVESAEQLAFLKGAGCDQVQGFLFGQPMPDDAVARLLRNLKKSMGGRQGPTRSASNVA